MLFHDEMQNNGFSKKNHTSLLLKLTLIKFKNKNKKAPNEFALEYFQKVKILQKN